MSDELPPQDQTSFCPKCRRRLNASLLMGLCPDCLLAAGFSAVPETGGARSFEPPSPEELTPRFPDLEIIELLGRGGMGAVYKARQRRLDRLVALKILPPGLGDAPSFSSRFEREARALAKLLHSNIVTLFEFGESAGQFYFLMEYVEGVTLRQLLKNGGLPPREALAIVAQVCDALQFAHDHGIVHRDIKPENILIDRKGGAKIADFGVVRIVTGEEGDSLAASASAPEHGRTEAGKIIGTPQYMAPEQKEHPGDVDHRADVYALGVVFYEMLTGELPGQPIEVPSGKIGIDVRLDEIVLRALEREPARRYQEVREMRTSVETVAAMPERSRDSDTGIESRVLQNNPLRFIGPLAGAILGGTLIAALMLALGHFTAALAIFASAISFAIVFAAVRVLVVPKQATNGNSAPAESGQSTNNRVLAWSAACLLAILGGGIVFVAAGGDKFRRWYQAAMDNVPAHPIRSANSGSAGFVTAADVEETLRNAITARMRDAGFEPESVSIYITPDLKKAECRLGRVSQGGLFSEPWNGSFELQPQGGNTWRVEGKGELRALKFSVNVPPAGLGDSLPEPGNTEARIRFSAEKQLSLVEVAERGQFQLLNLNTGEFEPLPTDFPQKSDEEQQQWVLESDGDLMLSHFPNGDWGLFTIESKAVELVKIDDTLWRQEGIDAGEFARLLNSPPMASKSLKGFLGYVLSRDPELPMTFLYRTTAGTTGLLRITEFTKNPRAAKLLLKIAETELSGNPAAGTGRRASGLISPQEENPSRLVFSVEEEFTLADIGGDSPFRFLNLRTGKFIPPPANFKNWPDEDLKEWMSQNPEVLILTGGGDRGWELITYIKPNQGTRFLKIDEHHWEEKTIDQEELIRLKATPNSLPVAGSSQGETTGQGFVTRSVKTWPTTFLFRSHAGITRLLRIEEITDLPGSAKIILRTPKRENKTDIVPGKENTQKTPSPELFNFNGFFPSWKETAQKTLETELERAVEQLETVRKLADANMISRMELLQVEEKEALLRAEVEGSPAPAIAAIKVRFARERLERKQAHFNAGIIPQTEIDAAQSELRNAEAELEQAFSLLRRDEE